MRVKQVNRVRYQVYDASANTTHYLEIGTETTTYVLNEKHF